MQNENEQSQLYESESCTVWYISLKADVKIGPIWLSIQTSTGVHSLVSCTDDPDMEFATSGTCVKYIQAGVKFSRTKAKN